MSYRKPSGAPVVKEGKKNNYSVAYECERI